MITSRVLPGAIPTPFLPPASMTPDTRKRSEQNDVMAGTEGRGMQPPDKYFKVGSPDKDAMFERACPSTFPYLLTLRGHDIHRDQLLYPLTSSCLTMGRHLPPSSSHHIHLLADDVQNIHCRLYRKTLPLNDASRPPASGPRYCYCLQVEVLDRAVVFVNGLRVEISATVHPGDVVAVGHQYLFLFKDPTRGHDIPDTLPWYSGSSYLYAHVNKASSVRNGARDMQNGEQQEMMKAAASENKDHEYCELEYQEKKDSPEDVELTVPYPQEKEQEVLDYITTLTTPAPTPAHFPLTPTLLLLGCHGYASRHFPPSHQAAFFPRLLAAVRNRVSMLSKTLSTLKYQTKLYTTAQDSSAQDVQSHGDPILDLLSWLSNCVRIFSHVTSSHFRFRLETLQPGPEATESLQTLSEGLGETITFMFQQTVYCVTKVLYGAVVEMLHPGPPPSSPQADQARALSAMDRVLNVLRVTLDVSEDVSLHRDVTIQLLMYLIFFVTTTMFNKLVTNGGEGHPQLCWSLGVSLQCCVSSLENWVSSVGLESQYLRVSEPLVSVVDLLATSTHSLLKMDWSDFRGQYRALTDGQLTRVLSEYRFSDGQGPPLSWSTLSSQGSPAEEVTISLSSHPPFVLPQHGVMVDLKPPYPPPLHTHLHHLAARFPPSTGFNGQQPSPRTPHPPSDLPLPTPSPGTFFSSSVSSPSSSPSSSFVPKAFPTHTHHHHHHHNHHPLNLPSLPSLQTNQPKVQSPPLPHRHARDSPPPLPPRRPSRTSASQSSSQPQEKAVRFGTDSNPTTSSSQQRFGEESREPVSDVTRSAVVNPVGERRAQNERRDSDGSRGVQERRVSQGGGGGGGGVIPQNARMPVQDTGSPSHVPEKARMPGSCGSDLSTTTRSSTTHNSLPPPEADPPSPHTARLSISQKLLQSGLTQHPSWNTHCSQNPRPLHQAHDHKLPQAQDYKLPQAQDYKHPQEPKARDPRRRPLDGRLFSSGPLTLQDKRLLNQVSLLEMPSETTSLASDSAISDDVFVLSSAEPSRGSSGQLGSPAQPAQLRRFSTGMLGQAGADSGEAEERKPRVVRVEMCQGDANEDHLVVERFPEDIYIEVAGDSGLGAAFPPDRAGVSTAFVDDVGSTKGSSQQNNHQQGSHQQGSHQQGSHQQGSHQQGSHQQSHHQQGSHQQSHHQQGSHQPPRIQYRHTMPQDRDCSTKGEITGEVFTLTLLKEGSKLGMGLVDGMYTALQCPGIYVRNVLAGTPAALCGHIRVGDRILAVNGRSIIGADYSSAMKLIRSTGPRLNLLVAKCDRSVTARVSAS